MHSLGGRARGEDVLPEKKGFEPASDCSRRIRSRWHRVRARSTSLHRDWDSNPVPGALNRQLASAAARDRMSSAEQLWAMPALSESPFQVARRVRWKFPAYQAQDRDQFA